MWEDKKLEGMSASFTDPASDLFLPGNTLGTYPFDIFGNIILLTDSYKVTHWKQYPPGTKTVYSYLEARTGGEYVEIPFFGLQYFLCKYLRGRVVNDAKIEFAKKILKGHFGKDLMYEEGWKHIAKDHFGRLPVEIKAVPEGMVVKEGNVLVTVENTCPECYWLTNYIETLLVEVWYPTAVATISREMKKVIWNAMKRSGTATRKNMMFRLHDFGFRGVSSPESAALGGSAHLVNFFGTDTLVALNMLHQLYAEPMAGFSIPAAEHSTITSWGQTKEVDAYRNMLNQFPDDAVAVVSDSWDLFNAAEKIWGLELKDLIVSRNGVLVVRPDSGDPNDVLPRLFDVLGKAFGYTTNDKGYRVLPDYLRVIQGDGIRRTTLKGILDSVMNSGWSADNISFGSGGGLLQNCDRDTQRVAFKCSSIEIGDERHDVFKRPATDPTKNSKRGRLKLVLREGEFTTVQQHGPGTDLLQTVFRKGTVTQWHKFSEVRARAQLPELL